MLKALVVDDIPDNVKLLTYDLQDAGYDVVSATNGKEAMRIIQDVGPQIVLSDWMMPEMDGLELCQAIRNSDLASYTYIIMLTAHSDQCRLVEAFDAGADDFLAKPFEGPELLARVQAGSRIVALEEELARDRLALHKMNAELCILNDKLERWATTDDLTALGNRREGMRYLDECWATTKRHGQSLSCLILDIDHFKACNDQFGHSTGDRILRGTADVLRNATRAGERTFRIGGEEFLVVCPSTDSEAATITAERLRAEVESNTIPHKGGTFKVTISVGAASLTEAHDTAEDLLGAADRALYAAKAAGRNCVVADNPTPSRNNRESRAVAT